MRPMLDEKTLSADAQARAFVENCITYARQHQERKEIEFIYCKLAKISQTQPIISALMAAYIRY